MGASKQALLDIYTKHVRSVLKFAAVVWNSSLTQDNIITIERVQKCAFSVILGVRYQSYEEACESLKMESLGKRRETLSRKFAVKSSKHPIHSQWFKPYHAETSTRSVKPDFKPVQGRTERLLKSAIPFLTNLLNKNSK